TPFSDSQESCCMQSVSSFLINITIQRSPPSSQMGILAIGFLFPHQHHNPAQPSVTPKHWW
ncbi:hypothetical protein, partial [Faecalibaculum rodentium]